MVGSFGTSPTDNGVVATTESSEKSGVFGSNTGTGPGPAGGVGGSGVFGLTVVPSAAGVFGANNHATAGVGVQGNGPEAGLSGFSEAGVGLRAHSSHGDGTQSFAHSSDHNAVFGSNDAGGTAPAGGAPAGIGVFGLTVVGGAAGVFGANNHATAGVGVQDPLCSDNTPRGSGRFVQDALLNQSRPLRLSGSQQTALNPGEGYAADW